MSDTRVYKVIHKPTNNVRLVRAVNKTAAFRFVADDTIEAEVASQDDLIGLVTAGTKVEESVEVES